MKTINKTVLAIVAAAAVLFTACEESNKTPDAPGIVIENGFYVINQGSEAGKIPGSITAYNSVTGESTGAMQDAFSNANGIRIGDSPMEGLVYGSKMYVAVYESDIIWVLNPNTLKVYGSIQPKESMQGHNPRALCAHGGKLYVSMFTGYVSVIDTVGYAIEREIKVGPNPEGLAVAGEKLYVANSDGMNWAANYADGSLSVIDLGDYSESKITDISKIFNPTKVMSYGSDVFVLCMGDYYTIEAAVWKISGADVDKFCPATDFAMNGAELYAVNNPYDSPNGPKYTVYNSVTGDSLRNMIDQTIGESSVILSPNGLGINPVSGEITVLSYRIASTGYPDYKNPGYANIYDNSGNFIKRIETGVGAVSVTFVN